MPGKRRKPKRADKSNSVKPGVSGKRYRTDPRFRKSRLAAADFGRASRCAVMIRGELLNMLEKMRQHDIHRSLSQSVIELLRKKRAADTQRVRLNDIDWVEFKNKDLNPEAGLGTLLFHAPAVSVDRLSGKIEITHPSFMITKKVTEKKSGTHVRLIAGAAAIDFGRRTSCHDYTATDYFLKEKIPEGEIKLSMQLPGPITAPLFVVLGLVCATQERDNVLYPLANRRYMALQIIYAQPAPPSAYKAKAATPAKKKATKKPVSGKLIKKSKSKTPVKKTRTSSKAKK